MVLLDLGTGSRRESVCRCRQGAIAAAQGNPAHHQQQVDSLWQLWQQQQQLFKPQGSVDIQVKEQLIAICCCPCPEHLYTYAVEYHLHHLTRFLQLPKIMQRVKQKPPEEDLAGSISCEIALHVHAHHHDN